MQVAFFCCFRQGVAGMSRDLSRDVPDLEKLYARKLWADFSYPIWGWGGGGAPSGGGGGGGRRGPIYRENEPLYRPKFAQKKVFFHREALRG